MPPIVVDDELKPFLSACEIVHVERRERFRSGSIGELGKLYVNVHFGFGDGKFGCQVARQCADDIVREEDLGDDERGSFLAEIFRYLVSLGYRRAPDYDTTWRSDDDDEHHYLAFMSVDSRKRARE
jgi:hypothetical protein